MKELLKIRWAIAETITELICVQEKLYDLFISIAREECKHYNHAHQFRDCKHASNPGTSCDARYCPLGGIRSKAIRKISKLPIITSLPSYVKTRMRIPVGHKEG